MAPLLALLLVVGTTVAPAPESSETVQVVVPADTDIASTSDSLGQTENVPEGPWVSVEVPVDGSVDQTIARLSEDLGEPVFEDEILELFDPTDEPLFPEQWHLQNSGQGAGSADADVDAPTAWARALGAGVVVAVIDSGVDLAHPDLDGRIHPVGRDVVDGDNDPSPGGTSGDDGHGTRVAGVIAAGDNGIGGAGVAPGARIMAIRACSGGGCQTSDVANGIHFAVDHGAHIINLSIGAILSTGGAVANAVQYARAHDVTVVAAAGNASPGIDLDQLPPNQIMVPGGLPYSNVLSVAATDRNDRLSGFSNFGRTTVDVAAPGEDIRTTDNGGGYVFATGTSFSSPLVAGVAALLLSSDPGIGHHELIARVKAFVDRPGIVPSRVETGRVNAGRSLTRRFVDISGSVFLSAIEHLAAIGVTQGCNPPHNTSYCPDNQVTRGQMAAFLSRAFDLPNTPTDYFRDDEGAFYEDAANRMAAAGLTTGCAPNRYCGEQQIPRAQMAAMLSRGLNLPPGRGDQFVDDNASQFEGAINRVAAAGITFGCNPPQNNRFCPGDSVTRGQMAGFVRRTLDLINP
jgi:hypothetical protein